MSGPPRSRTVRTLGEAVSVRKIRREVWRYVSLAKRGDAFHTGVHPSFSNPCVGCSTHEVRRVDLVTSPLGGE